MADIADTKGFDMGGRKPFYTNEGFGIAFYGNPKDHPDGYDILIGRDYLCLQSRILDELVDERTTAEEAVRKLDNATNRQTSHHLEEHGITPVSFHSCLKSVKIKQLEEERGHYLDEISELRDR